MSSRGEDLQTVGCQQLVDAPGQGQVLVAGEEGLELVVGQPILAGQQGAQEIVGECG